MLRPWKRILLVILVAGMSVGCGPQSGPSAPPSEPGTPGQTGQATSGEAPCQSGTDSLTVMGASLGSPAAPLEEKLGKPQSVETNSKYDDEIHQYAFGFVRISAERKTLKAMNLKDGPANLELWPGVTFGSPYDAVKEQLARLGHCPTFSSVQTLRFEQGADLLIVNFEEGHLRGLTLGE